MYGAGEYPWGIAFYLLGTALLAVPLWWATARLPRPGVRRALRLLLLAILLTPVPAHPGQPWLAPAWVVALFEAFHPTAPEGPARALAALVVAAAAALGLAALPWLARRIRRLRGDGRHG